MKRLLAWIFSAAVVLAPIHARAVGILSPILYQHKASGGGGSTFSLVNHVIAQSTTSISVTTAPTDYTLGAGANLLTACVSDYPAGGALASITDSVGTNTWVNAASVVDGATATRTTLFYAANAHVSSTMTVSYNIGGAGQYPTLSVQGWSGAAASSPLDVHNSNSGNSATLSTGSVTPGQANELLVACLGVQFGVNGTITVDTATSAFNMLDQAVNASGFAIGGAVADQIQTTITARNPVFTDSAGAFNMTAVIGTFKP